MLKFSGSEIIYRLAPGESNELGSGSIWERSRNSFETTDSKKTPGEALIETTARRGEAEILIREGEPPVNLAHRIDVAFAVIYDVREFPRAVIRIDFRPV